ncbi:MAG: type III toxin-antitoxin system ToxN/AbiQ family toxin [Clostridiales bacterium]|jgi:hypothetical protein|nr:type III toxin-antitoxin system ToxN/AbiQ family toxin [Clostridiales bacterium]
MQKLKFYEVDAEYIRYLTAVDSKVPRIDYSEAGRHNKFLCGIVLAVGGHNYFAPVSSFKTPQRSSFIIKTAVISRRLRLHALSTRTRVDRELFSSRLATQQRCRDNLSSKLYGTLS